VLRHLVLLMRALEPLFSFPRHAIVVVLGESLGSRISDERAGHYPTFHL